IWQSARNRIRHPITPSDPGGVSACTDAHRKFRWPGRFHFSSRDPGRDCHQRFLLELVRLSHCLYRQLHADPDCRISLYSDCCLVGSAENFTANGTLREVILFTCVLALANHCSRCVSLPRSSRTVRARRPFVIPYVASAPSSLRLKCRSCEVL